MDIWTYLNRDYKPDVEETGDSNYLMESPKGLSEGTTRECFMALNRINRSALTITFKPKIHDSCTFMQMRNLVNNIFKGCRVEGVLYYDIDSNNRFHYHGIISGTAKDKHMLIYAINKFLGFKCVKYIDNIERWYEYCTKYMRQCNHLDPYDLNMCVLQLTQKTFNSIN